jgi:hypothetical protein
MCFLVAAAALHPAVAEAGHGHCHGHGGWHVDLFYGGGWPGPYYRPWPYYNYAYVAPPPVIYAPPTVVTVPALTSVQTQTAPATSLPTVPTTVRANPAPASRNFGVTLRNPADSGTTIAFVVDSRTEVDLAPGETMPLVEKSAYFIEFDRGGDFGTSKRTLTEGTYEFVGTESGWDLRRADAVDPVTTPVVRRNNLPTTK